MSKIRLIVPSLALISVKKIAVLFAVIFCLQSGLLCYAAPTTATQAGNAVQRLLAGNGTPLNMTLGQNVKDVTSYPLLAKTPAYFVVNLDPSGYIIVSSDDTIEPIIAFVENGSYSPTADNPLGALVIQDMDNRLATAQQAANTRILSAGLSQAQEKWAILAAPITRAITNPLATPSDIRVAPLVKSSWGQTNCGGYTNTPTCYNYYTPNNYHSGCVATAMAQLMRYHQYPTDGVGTASFNITINGGTATPRALRGGDGSGGPYDWANMPLEPKSNALTVPLVQRQAIGALCADAGVAVKMDYASAGSAAFSNDTKVAMTQVFKYGNAIIGGNSNIANNNIMANLPKMINPDLDAGYPVFFAISGTPGGHAILSDGYGFDTGTAYHHLNMGWSGISDTWYNLPTIPSAAGTFTYLKMCLYNVFPQGSGEVISGRVLDLAGNPISGATVTALPVGGIALPAVLTDSKGIYAFAKLPSNKTFTLTATKDGLPPKMISTTTGTSVDYSYTSGNIWGADITLGGVSITTGALPAGSVNIPYRFTVQAIDGTQPYSWSAVSLPAGLDINSLTGEITGTVVTAGQTGVIINIHDATSTPTLDSRTFQLNFKNRVATPAFSPDMGTFVGSLGVTLTCATAGAVIHYTLDNTDPSATNGSIYDPAVGILLTETTILKAYAVNAGMDDSAIASKTYTINNPPNIVSFTPTGGASGAMVTITGNHFTDATAVTVNGQAADFTVVNDTTINAVLPSGATSGIICVTTPIGSGTSATSFKVLQSLLLSVSVVSPTAVGTTIKMTASPTLLPATLEYKFRVKYTDPLGAAVWQILQDYSPLNSCSWKPTEAHGYTIFAYARVPGTTMSYLVYREQPMTVKLGVTALRAGITLTSPISVGMATKISAIPTNGGTLQYCFKAKYSNGVGGYTWLTLQEYSPLNSYTWQPTEARSYILYAYAREKGSSVSYTAFKEIPFVVNLPVSEVILTTSIAAPTGVGTSVKLLATPTKGGTLEYKFYALYLDAGGVERTEAIRDYSTVNPATWVPKLATTYTIVALAREKGKDVSYDIIRSIPGYLVKPAITILKLTATPASVGKVGTAVLLTTTPTGGGTLEYLFKAKYPNGVGGYTWLTLQEYSQLTSANWTPASAQTYTLYAYAREKGTTISYKVFRDMVYLVNP